MLHARCSPRQRRQGQFERLQSPPAALQRRRGAHARAPQARSDVRGDARRIQPYRHVAILPQAAGRAGARVSAVTNTVLLPRASAPTTTHTTTAVQRRGALRCTRGTPASPFMRMGHPRVLLPSASRWRRHAVVAGVRTRTPGGTGMVELGARGGARRAVPTRLHLRRRARRIKLGVRVGGTLGSMARISTLRG